MSAENRDEYLYTWKIENFSLFHMKNGEELKSPLFNAETLNGTKWFVSLYPSGYNRESEGYASCFVCRLDEDTSVDEITIDFSIEMIGANGKILRCYERENRIFKRIGNLGQYKFISIDQLRTNMKDKADDTLTIRCRLTMNQNKKEKMATGSEALTKIGISRSSFKWNVKIPDSLEWSQNLTFSSQDISQFEVSVLAPEEHVQIKICKIVDENVSLSRLATFRITFLNDKGMVIDSKSDTHLFVTTDDKSTWDFPTFITKEQVEIRMGSSIWYVFTLMCEISMSNGNVLSAIENYTFGQPLSVDLIPRTSVSPLFALQEDLRNIYADKKHCDVRLRAENETISAHKFVLVARSPVFSAMFEQDMIENQTGEVDILDMDGTTLKSFLEFMYTGIVDEMDYGIATKLLIAADKYQVQSLKNMCSAFLMSVLCLKNVCEITTIADLVNDENLKSVVFNYIKANASCILASPEWAEWIGKNFKLASEIFSKLSVDLGSTSNKI
ncbi:speckle-type POZ protein B-like [Parasteatoda tepidariorum]|uniref:speckle-type POZ protein B-like n=1 Tax=Parasteatoda tepidariorum TaxID=114398 RepID=UPI0039BC3C25